MNRITTNPDVCGGRPCIRGLRIRVKDVLDLLAAGASREEIIVTKDEDFAVFNLLHHGPGIVWIRLGNTRKADLLHRIEQTSPRL